MRTNVRIIGCLAVLAVLLIPVSAAVAEWRRDLSFPQQDVTDVEVIGPWLYFSSANSVYRKAPQSGSASEVGSLGDSAVISVLFGAGTKLIAGTYGRGIYESLDSGNTWERRSSGLAGQEANAITCIVTRGDSVYIGTSGAGIFVSQVSGTFSWKPFRDGLPWNLAWEIYSLYNWNGILYSGAGLSGYVYRNFRDSSVWNYLLFEDNVGTGRAMLGLGANGGNMLIGTASNGIYHSFDSGATWQLFAAPFSAASQGKVLNFEGRTLAIFSHVTLGIHIYEWRNGTWELWDIQAGLVAYDFVYFDGHLYAACWDGLWRYPLNPTEVDPSKPVLPTSPSLAQNYPNPFNPETRIEYSLPERSHVTLSIFNLLGQKVRTLVDREEPAGSHAATWDGTTDSGQPAATGVYLYRIRAGQFTETKRMVLLK